jgi:PAS domain S-box-containing protein
MKRVTQDTRIVAKPAIITQVPRSRPAERAATTLPEKIIAAYTVLEPLPTAMMITDTFGSCVFANSEALRLVACELDDLLGVKWLQIIHHEDRPGFVTGWSRALKLSTEYLTRVRILDTHGRDYAVSLRARPLMGDCGETVGQVGIFEPEGAPCRGDLSFTFDRALTDQSMQEQLLEQRARLIEAERALRSEREILARIKDDFLCTVSHELRTPLHAILGWSQILSKRQGDDATVERSVEVIQRNGHALARLLEDMLDMKSVLNGEARLSVELLELKPLVQSVIDALSHTAITKKVSVTFDNSDQGRPIIGDAMRLRKVLWNLLSNAIKFTPGGGEVRLRLEFTREQVHITVADTGCGIAPEFLPHLFEPFRQADGSTTRSYGGLGMGLALSRRLVELHGGYVCAHSQGLQRGASFTVVLPAPEVC